MKDPIGIIGGMGPMASQLFYKMVTEHTAAEKDQDHINLILLSDACMRDRTISCWRMPASWRRQAAGRLPLPATQRISSPI